MERNIEELVSRAEGSTVTEGLLTQISPNELGEVDDAYSTASEDEWFVAKKPVIEYLQNSEEPQFIFHAKAYWGGSSSCIADCQALINGERVFEKQYRQEGGLVICFTDKNVILIRDSIPPDGWIDALTSDEGKHSINVAYDDVEKFEFEWAGHKISHQIKLITNDRDTCEIRIPNKYEDSEINSLILYLKEKVSRSEAQTTKETKEKTIVSNKRTTRSVSQEDYLQALKSIDPYKFEKIVADLWRSRGWEVRLTSQSSDKGVDVIAQKEDGLESRRHLIQAKRYGDDTLVDSQEIQRYAGLYAKEEQVDGVFVVTTSKFTSDAKNVAENRNVEIINGKKLINLLDEENILDSVG